MGDEATSLTLDQQGINSDRSRGPGVIFPLHPAKTEKEWPLQQRYRRILHTDDAKYGGAGQVGATEHDLAKGQATISMPPKSLVLLEGVEE